MPQPQIVVLDHLSFSTIQHLKWQQIHRLVLLTKPAMSIEETLQLLTIQQQYPKLVIDLLACENQLACAFILGKLSARYPHKQICLQLEQQSAAFAEFATNSGYPAVESSPSKATTDPKLKMLIDRYDNKSYDPLNHSRPINSVLADQVIGE